MNTLKVAVISIATALVVAVGVTYFAPTKTETIREVVREVIQGKTSDKVGAVSGPEIFYDSWTVNGVRTHFLKQGFRTGTTTLCSITVPQYNIASTTLLSAGAKFLGVPTTTGRLRIYTGLGQNSTTTLLAGGAIGTLATGTTIVATTSLTSNDARMGANANYVVFDFEGGSSPYLDINGSTGFCSAEFREF